MNILPKPFLIIVGLVVLVLIAGAEIVASSIAGVGRYTIVPVGSGSDPCVYMIDTKSGRVLEKAGFNSRWTDATPTPTNTDTN